MEAATIRGRRLPAVAQTAEAVCEARQYLTFSLGGEMFGVATRQVKEIIEYGQLTNLPMMPAFLRGVINLRGAGVPVIDLSARFGNAPTEVGRRSCVVILEVVSYELQQDVGVIVDAVSAVLEIAPAQIAPPPTFGAAIRTDFILGMAKIDAGFVILLDVGQVLSVNEIAALAAAGSAENGSGMSDQPNR